MRAVGKGRGKVGVGVVGEGAWQLRHPLAQCREGRAGSYGSFPHLLQLQSWGDPRPTPAHMAGDITALDGAACDVTVGARGVFRVRAGEKRPIGGRAGAGR